MKRLKPFVFRRYLDYGAYKSLREMKLLIEREVRQQGLFDDIKLGAGGIREIEFIVQVHQLVHGGFSTSAWAICPRRCSTIWGAWAGPCPMSARSSP